MYSQIRHISGVSRIFSRGGEIPSFPIFLVNIFLYILSPPPPFYFCIIEAIWFSDMIIILQVIHAVCFQNITGCERQALKSWVVKWCAELSPREFSPLGIFAAGNFHRGNFRRREFSPPGIFAAGNFRRGKFHCWEFSPAGIFRVKEIFWNCVQKLPRRVSAENRGLGSV